MKTQNQNDKATASNAISGLRSLQASMFHNGQRTDAEIIRQALDVIEREHAALVAVVEAAENTLGFLVESLAVEERNGHVANVEWLENLIAQNKTALANLAAVRGQK